MEWERVLLFATQVGKLARLLETTVRYGRTRHQFGQPIGRFQSVSNKVADMRVNLELGRLIVYKAAWLKGQGMRAAVEASIAKLFVSESCKTASLDALQLHGGYGYMKEAGLSAGGARQHRIDHLLRHLRNPAEHHREAQRSLA